MAQEQLTHMESVAKARSEYEKAIAEPLAAYEMAVAQAQAKARADYEKAIAEPIAVYEKTVADAVAIARTIYAEAIAEPLKTFDELIARAVAEAEAFEWRYEAQAEALASVRKAKSQNRKANATDTAIKSLIDAQNRQT